MSAVTPTHLHYTPTYPTFHVRRRRRSAHWYHHTPSGIMSNTPRFEASGVIQEWTPTQIKKMETAANKPVKVTLDAKGAVMVFQDPEDMAGFWVKPPIKDEPPKYIFKNDLSEKTPEEWTIEYPLTLQKMYMSLQKASSALGVEWEDKTDTDIRGRPYVGQSRQTEDYKGPRYFYAYVEKKVFIYRNSNEARKELQDMFPTITTDKIERYRDGGQPQQKTVSQVVPVLISDTGIQVTFSTSDPPPENTDRARQSIIKTYTAELHQTKEKYCDIDGNTEKYTDVQPSTGWTMVKKLAEPFVQMFVDFFNFLLKMGKTLATALLPATVVKFIETSVAQMKDKAVGIAEYLNVNAGLKRLVDGFMNTMEQMSPQCISDTNGEKFFLYALRPHPTNWKVATTALALVGGALSALTLTAALFFTGAVGMGSVAAALGTVWNTISPSFLTTGALLTKFPFMQTFWKDFLDLKKLVAQGFFGAKDAVVSVVGGVEYVTEKSDQKERMVWTFIRKGVGALFSMGSYVIPSLKKPASAGNKFNSAYDKILQNGIVKEIMQKDQMRRAWSRCLGLTGQDVGHAMYIANPVNLLYFFLSMCTAVLQAPGNLLCSVCHGLDKFINEQPIRDSNAPAFTNMDGYFPGVRHTALICDAP